MNSNAIVTLADSNYFELLIELINSINTHDKNKSVSICVLDAGLTEKQNRAMASCNAMFHLNVMLCLHRIALVAP